MLNGLGPLDLKIEKENQEFRRTVRGPSQLTELIFYHDEARMPLVSVEVLNYSVRLSSSILKMLATMSDVDATSCIRTLLAGPMITQMVLDALASHDKEGFRATLNAASEEGYRYA